MMRDEGESARASASVSESLALSRKERHTVAALRGVRGSASLPERATELYSHGSTHRWLVGRIVCWLDFLDIMDSMVGMDVMVRMDLLDSMELMVAGVALNLRAFYL